MNKEDTQSINHWLHDPRPLVSVPCFRAIYYVNRAAALMLRARVQQPYVMVYNFSHDRSAFRIRSLTADEAVGREASPIFIDAELPVSVQYFYAPSTTYMFHMMGLAIDEDHEFELQEAEGGDLSFKVIR